VLYHCLGPSAQLLSFNVYFNYLFLAALGFELRVLLLLDALHQTKYILCFKLEENNINFPPQHHGYEYSVSFNEEILLNHLKPKSKKFFIALLAEVAYLLGSLCVFLLLQSMLLHSTV
jgi:hypothetical protein